MSRETIAAKGTVPKTELGAKNAFAVAKTKKRGHYWCVWWGLDLEAPTIASGFAQTREEAEAQVRQHGGTIQMASRAARAHHRARGRQRAAQEPRS